MRATLPGESNAQIISSIMNLVCPLIVVTIIFAFLDHAWRFGHRWSRFLNSRSQCSV
jgi:hypothetical protein